MMAGMIVVKKVLGFRNCYECGGENTRRLIVSAAGDVYSRCFRCGFMEWEWAWGDPIDYLQHLAELYNVSYSELIETIFSPGLSNNKISHLKILTATVLVP